MKKNLTLTLLLALLAFSCTSVSCFAFTDTSGGWYEETVNYATKHGIINGYEDNTFRPDNNVSKAEIIKLVVARYADNVSTAYYPEHWAINYVRFAEQNNIIPTGMYNESNLDLPASRKEICYMLIQACRNIAYKPVLDDTGMKLDFEDLNEENKNNINENGIDYAQAMRLCYAMGIIKGYPTEERYTYTEPDGTTVLVINDNLPKLVKPNENVTRAEATTMVARTYFAGHREYTYVERTGNELPSNAADFPKTYTYMPKSFYEAGETSFFNYLQDRKPVNFFSKYSLDSGMGKARIEGAYDTLFNVSYKMTDEQWKLWKEEMTVFDNIKGDVEAGALYLDKYIQFVKDNKIVSRGGYICDPVTAGTVKSNITPGIDSKNLLKGIGTLYIENPNNLENISLEQFELGTTTAIINKSFEQGYVFFIMGSLKDITTNYIQNMGLYSYFYFSNN